MIERYDYHRRRLMGRVALEGTCLVWNGPVFHTGHGMISYGRKMRQAHRFAWFLEHGEWPEGNLNHRCGNPRCVRPSHLYIGDQHANVLDALAHGTWRSQRVSPAQAIEIRERYKAGGVSQRALAAEYGIGQATVSNIVTGHTWSHADETATRGLAC